MVLLAAAAALLLAGTLWLWPVLARRGPAFVVLRLALLVALQVSVVGAVFVWVNRSFEFYASWADLLGTNHAVAQVAAVRPGAVHAAVVRPASRVVVLATSPVAIPGTRRGPGGKPVAGRPGGGRLEKVRFDGAVSGIRATGHVYLPPGYTAASRPLPVIVVIGRHAGKGTGYRAPQVAAAAAAQIESGRMAPAIIAMLSPAVAGRADQGCLDSPGGPQAGTFFTQDLPQALVRDYRAAPGPAGWAVLGAQGGGYCALQLATAASGQFRVAVAPPGTYTAPPGGGGTGASPWLRSQGNLLWRLRHWPPPPIRVLFTGPGRPGQPGQPGQFISLVRPPMTVATAATAGRPPPLAAVLDWIGHALAARS